MERSAGGAMGRFCVHCECALVDGLTSVYFRWLEVSGIENFYPKVFL
jgi:hypothetical protein